MFRKLFACCLRQRSEAEEDMLRKPKHMSDARWRARFEEEELVPVAAQAQKKAPPTPPSPDVYGEAIGKVNDARVILTAALVHEPPATVAEEEEEEEDLQPTARRWRVCRRHWAEVMTANATCRRRADRAFRPGRR